MTFQTLYLLAAAAGRIRLPIVFWVFAVGVVFLLVLKIGQRWI